MKRWPVVAVAASVVLLALRLHAARVLGFGDAEALYACYARHPQPVYLDHPGLIGVVARLFGRGEAPTPFAAHLGTALLATLAPWFGALAARAAGASRTGACLAAAALLLTPEISIGLFGMTPDLPLILLWYAALAFAALALRSEPGSARALAFVLGAAFAAGLACDAKASGALLLVGLVATFAQPLARLHLRTLAPWAGLALVLVLVAPVVIDEVERGLPMLRHRLIDTQRGSGLSVRNLGALFGGQLLYVTPPLLYAAYLVARDLYRRRSDDAVSSLIFCVTAATTPLVVLACLSRVAEPHWVAPLYLALPLHLARIAERTPKLLSPVVTGLATAIGVATIAVAHAAVLLPLAPRWLGARYEPRYDLANDLFAWRTGLPLVRRALLVTLAPGAPPPVVVGPHWTVCAQLHAALPASVLVGCSGEIPDDFSRWLPPSLWQEAPVVLLVSDDRFDRASSSMRGRRLDAAWHVDVERGGRAVRRITVERWVATATASR